MNQTTRQERTIRFYGSLSASIEHLFEAMAALDQCNLYSNDQQEISIDQFIAQTRKQILDMRQTFGYPEVTIEQAKENINNGKKTPEQEQEQQPNRYNSRR